MDLNALPVDTPVNEHTHRRVISGARRPGLNLRNTGDDIHLCGNFGVTQLCLKDGKSCHEDVSSFRFFFSYILHQVVHENKDTTHLLSIYTIEPIAAINIRFILLDVMILFYFFIIVNPAFIERLQANQSWRVNSFSFQLFVQNVNCVQGLIRTPGRDPNTVLSRSRVRISLGLPEPGRTGSIRAAAERPGSLIGTNWQCVCGPTACGSELWIDGDA